MSKNGTTIKKKGQKKFGFLFLFSVCLIAIMAAPTAVLLAVGLLPTFVSWIWDRDPEKYAALTVGCLNLCGALIYVFELWQGSNSMNKAVAIMSDPMSWMVMYGAATAGWGVYFIVPSVTASILVLKAEHELKEIDNERQALQQEFGSDVYKAE